MAFLLAHRGRVWLLGMACALVLGLGVVSRFDSHPDEGLHVLSAAYYHNHWLPPAVSDPELPRFLNPTWGANYITSSPPEITYLLGAKFARLFGGPGGGSWRPFRTYAWVLWLVLVLSVALRPRLDPVYALFLMLTPQVWYVFGYFNGDAFPFFVAFLIALELGRADSLAQRYFAATAPCSSWRQALPLGLLCGLLVLSRIHYAVVSLYVAMYAAWQVAFAAGPVERRLLIGKWAIIVGIAVLVVLPFIGVDLARNGFDKAAQAQALQELYAAPPFMPSQATSAQAHDGGWLKQRGAPLADLFEKRGWHRLTMQSFLGVYGYMSIAGSKPQYVFQLAGLLALGVLLGWLVVREPSRRALAIALAAALSCGAVIVASVHYSWTCDFEPQGRYLFPMLPILLITWRTIAGERRLRAVEWLVPWFFFTSAVSFVFVCLREIPK